MELEKARLRMEEEKAKMMHEQETKRLEVEKLKIEHDMYVIVLFTRFNTSKKD